MLLGVIKSKVYEHFIVINETGTLASGIDVSEFSVSLFNPSGVEVNDSIGVNISEIGAGYYRAEFVPDQVGTWYMNVFHPLYFPWGKSDDIQVYTSDFNRLAGDLSRVLGLTQENYYLDNTNYIEHKGIKLLINGRLRIYEDAANVGTDNGVIATYKIISTWSGSELNTYKVIKV